MTEKYVTLPREVVEQTLEALIYCEAPDSSSEEQRFQAAITLRSALEQPQGEQAQIGSHRDAQEVPFEAWWEKHGQFLRTGGGQYEKTFAWHAWCEATKKPQPQGEQEPVGFVRQVDIEHLGNTPSDWASMFGQATGYNTVPVYTSQLPKREPLTDEQIGKIGREHEKFAKDGSEWFDRWTFARAIEAAHNIK